MYSLGIHDGNNSAACLMKDGEIIYAIQEERISRIKNYWGPPIESIRACFSFAKIGLEDLHDIAFAGHEVPAKPHISRDEYLAYTRAMLRNRSTKAVLRANWERAMSLFAKPRYDVEKRLYFYRDLGFERFPRERIKTIRHHNCHFATAAFGSDNGLGKDLLVITVDGFGDGENATVTVLDKSGSARKLFSSPDTQPFARLYAWVTVYLGFTHHEHEYKLMGMAPYANPIRARKVAAKFSELLRFEGGGWTYWRGHVRPEVDDHLIYEDIRRILEFERFDDICGGLQLFSEELAVKFVEYWVEKAGIRHIALSGGFFMNVKVNQLLRNSRHVGSIYVFPSCGDESNSIGAAMSNYYSNTGRRPKAIREFTLGDSIENVNADELRQLCREGAEVEVIRFEDMETEVARLLAGGKIVARVKGREEFGARALGNRSILANPSDWHSVQIINDMIKSRDFWMPFAASMIAEDKERYLKNCNDGYWAHYMIMTYDSINTAEILAATHPKDQTVRPQVVTREFNPDYHRLIEAFKKITGIGAVLNTSYNLHGYPLVHGVKDAVDVLLGSGLEYLAVGNFLLHRIGSGVSALTPP